MPENKLASGLQGGNVLLGVGLMYPEAGIVESMARGWDFVWVDGQHGQFTLPTILNALRAADAVGIASVLRVPSQEKGILGMYADAAPSAVMVPLVNSAEEARSALDGLRFPPNGKRSYGGRRVIDLYGRDYYRDAEQMVICQIETLEAVDHAAAIASVEGVDMLFFGPDDMKLAMGLSVNTDLASNKQLCDAMEKTAHAARTTGKTCGCIAASPAMVKLAMKMGYQLLVGGADIGFLRTSAAAKLTELREACKP